MTDDGKTCLKRRPGSAVRRSYSITLSARATIMGGITMPSVFAVFT